METGRIKQVAPDVLALFINGGLYECAMWIVHSDDPQATYEKVRVSFDQLLKIYGYKNPAPCRVFIITLRKRSDYLRTAIASISNLTSFGRRATSTQERAGYTALCSSKKAAYSAFTVAKSFRSLTKTVVFTISVTFRPACSMIALMLFSDWRA